MFKRVLLCYDGSEAGRRALKRGTELAIRLGAHVQLQDTLAGNGAARLTRGVTYRILAH
jgi:hypothetical protein